VKSLHRLLRRRGISGLVASIVLVAIAAQAVYAIITLYGRSYSALSRAYVNVVENVNAQSANIGVRVEGGEVYARSSAPLRIIGSYLIGSGGTLLRFEPLAPALTPDPKPLLNSTLTSAIMAGKYRALIIFNGGKYLLIDPSTLKQNSATSGTVRLTGDVISEIFAQDSSPINFTTPSPKLFHIAWFTYFVRGVTPQTLSLNTLYKLVISGDGIVNASFFNITEAVSGTSWGSAFFAGTVIYYDNVRYVNLTLTLGLKTPYSYYFLPSSYGRGVLGRVAYFIFPTSYSPTKPFNVILRILSTSFQIPTQVPLQHEVIKTYNYSGKWSGWTLTDKVTVYVNLTNAPPQGYILLGLEGCMYDKFTYYQNVRINSYG